MTVRRPTDSLPSSPVAPAPGVRADGGAAPDGATVRGEARPAAASADRLDLSGAAPTATARRTFTADPEASAELERARVALRAGGDLSAQRLHELRERVRTGHYDQPETVARVADAAVRDLTGGYPS